MSKIIFKDCNYSYKVETNGGRDEKGYITTPSKLHLYRNDILFATLDHKDKPIWFVQNSIQYALCLGCLSAVKNKDSNWQGYKTLIINCENGKIIETPIKNMGRGIYNVQFCKNVEFLYCLSDTGYEGYAFFYKIRDLETNPIETVPSLTKNLLNHIRYSYDRDSKTMFFQEYENEKDENEQNCEIQRDQLWVPNFFEFHWTYGNNVVNGFCIMTTLGYVLIDDIFKTWPSAYNQDNSINRKVIETQRETVVYKLENNIFRQIVYEKDQEYVDMPTDRFHAKYNEKHYLRTSFLNQLCLE